MTAVISQCLHYRYALEREVSLAPGPTFAFFGVNPSYADASINDNTVKKWIGFVQRWGGHGFVVGNVFAYRATDCTELAKVGDPIGPENWAHQQAIIEQADILVPCWGNRTKAPRRLWGEFDALATRLRASGKPVKVFGLTMGGDPLHPLMLAYSTPLIDWT